MQRVGNVLIGGNHRALILCGRLLQSLLGGALLMQQRTALEYGLIDIAVQAPERAARAEHPGDLRCIAAVVTGDRELRQHRGHRDADPGIGGMKLCFRGAHVRALFDDLGRQRERHLRWQPQRSEIEERVFLVRQPPDQGTHQIARLLELLLERGERRLKLRERGFLRRHVDAHRLPQAKMSAQDLERFLIRLDDRPSRLDLRPQRRLLNGRADDIGSERDVGGLEREALRVLLRSQGFHLAPVEPQHVGHETDTDLRRVKNWCSRRGTSRFVVRIFQARQKLSWPLASDAEGRALRWLFPDYLTVALRLETRRGNRRIIETPLGVERFPRLGQGCLGRRDGGIGLECLFDERIERRRLEELPPLEHDVPARGEMLDLAALHLRGRGARLR